MKTLVTGAAGFVGKHLIKYLQNDNQFDITVLALNKEEADSLEKYGIDIRISNILDSNNLKETLCEIRPDHIYHLAAQSSVELSWSNPKLTTDINIGGTINLLEAVRASSMDARILLIGSGDEYGTVRSEDVPINENTRLFPTSVYAATKACQNMIGRVYANAYNMNIIMTRAFNHIGPGQSPVFAVSDFCKQAVEIERGVTEPVIKVGNTNIKRDFTDVRDVVRAYALLMQKGVPGETYNICSGKSVSLHDILTMIIGQLGMDIIFRIDQKRFRPSDMAVIEADNSKLKTLTGWKSQISLEQSISDIIKYWQSML